MSAKRFFYIMAGLVLLTVFSILGSFYVGKNKLQAESTTMSDLLADRDITQEKIIRLEKVQKDSTQIGSINILLDRLVPDKKEQEKLVTDIIFTATSEVGIPFSQVSSFSFSGGGAEPNDLSGTVVSKENPGVYEYPFSLQINTISYDTLLKLLTEIETNSRIVQVDTVQITPDSSNPSVLSVSLTMKAYIKP